MGSRIIMKPLQFVFLYLFLKIDYKCGNVKDCINFTISKLKKMTLLLTPKIVDFTNSKVSKPEIFKNFSIPEKKYIMSHGLFTKKMNIHRKMSECFNDGAIITHRIFDKLTNQEYIRIGKYNKTEDGIVSNGVYFKSPSRFVYAHLNDKKDKNDNHTLWYTCNGWLGCRIEIDGKMIPICDYHYDVITRT